ACAVPVWYSGPRQVAQLGRDWDIPSARLSKPRPFRKRSIFLFSTRWVCPIESKGCRRRAGANFVCSGGRRSRASGDWAGKRARGDENRVFVPFPEQDIANLTPEIASIAAIHAACSEVCRILTLRCTQRENRLIF